MTANDRYTRPLARSAALVLIDVQRDFVDIPGDDAAMPVGGTRAAIPAMAKLATAFRERGLPIVHVVRLYQPDGSNVDLVRRQSIEQGARIAEPGSTGSQIAVELCPMLLSWTTNCCWPVASSESEPPNTSCTNQGGVRSTTPILIVICAKVGSIHWFSPGATSRTALGLRSTRHPNATSGLSWFRMRFLAWITGAFKNAVPSG